MKRFFNMKLNKFTVILAILLISILAIGAVSAESVDDSGAIAIDEDIGEVQESVEPTDVAEDLSTADTADDAVEDTGNTVLGDEPKEYDLDDDSYFTYFNEDGTATEVINESSDYTLNVGTLNNKDIKITYGSHINIVGKEGAGVINNGTITIGDSTGYAASVSISGLTFTNTNKDGIAVNQLSSDITINNNKFDLAYDSSYYNSPMAIVTYGYVDDVKITNNIIKMETAAGWNYGIDLTNWLPDWSQGIGNAEHFYVANNEINITSTANTGMVEAFYIDSVANSVFENNTIYTYTDEGASNYGIAVADSWGWTVLANLFNMDYVGGYSPYNITIKDNRVNIESDDMAYGITIISWNNADEMYDDIIKDMVVSNNNVTINSTKGAIGIGVQTSDVKITDNNIIIDANAFEPITSSPDPVFGNESYAILVDNLHKDFGYYYNTTVTDNIITTNVPAIVIEKTKGSSYSGPEPVVIEDNTVTYTGAVEYTIDDDHYFLFFNDDGTPTGLLNPEGEYTLFIDALYGKDIKIPTGKNISIFAKEGAGIINNGTITIGNGIDEISAVQVSGLTINNVNKDGIVIMQNAENIAVNKNNLNLTYDSTYYDSPMAIVSHGYVKDVDIVGNVINMLTEASYSYGIDLTICLPGWAIGRDSATNCYVADNEITILSLANPSPYTGMAEGMYLDSIVNSVIENNTISIKTVNEGVANYGISLADSTGYTYGAGSSPYNITIKDNSIILDSNDMTYGIAAMSSFPVQADSKNIVISGNDVNVFSTSGAMGIGAQSNDVLITDNTVTLTADPTKEPKCSADVLGTESCGIFADNFQNVTDEIYFSNNTVTNNKVTSNVPAIKAAKTVEEDERVAPLVIEDNEEQKSILIDDSTFDTYFYANGTIKEDAIDPNDVLLLGDLTAKKLVINIPLTINGVPNKKVANCTINVIAGADGTVIDGLNMVNDIKASTAVIYIEEVSNVTVSNCAITIPSATKMAYAIEVGPGSLGCKNIYINNNIFDITSSYNYAYGIDVYQVDTAENKHQGIYILENTILINSTGKKMAEAIYVTASEDVTIDGNIIKVVSNGSAYGIATDRIADEVIANNDITLEAGTMAYGITATTEGSDVIIRANVINAKGTGAVGVGINNQTDVTIEDNTISIDGGDYTSITAADSLGAANAGILVGNGNTNVEVSGNDVAETSAVRLNTTLDVSDISVTAAPSGEDELEITLKTISGMLLPNQTVKAVFNNQMFELTTDANGVAKLPFALNKAGTYNVDIFYLGDDNYRGSDASAKITINKIATKLTSAGKTYLATAKTKSLTATLKDANGNALAGKKVTFTANGKTVTATTNAKGVATAKLALTAAKTYTVTIKFAGDNVYAASTASAKVKLNKEKTKITAPKKTFKKAKKVKKVVITLKNSKGKVIAKKKVTLIVNKKKLTAKTNKKGKATFKVKNLKKKGTFKYTAKFAGDSQYKAVKKNGKIKVK